MSTSSRDAPARRSERSFHDPEPERHARRMEHPTLPTERAMRRLEHAVSELEHGARLPERVTRQLEHDVGELERGLG